MDPLQMLLVGLGGFGAIVTIMVLLFFIQMIWEKATERRLKKFCEGCGTANVTLYRKTKKFDTRSGGIVLSYEKLYGCPYGAKLAPYSREGHYGVEYGGGELLTQEEMAAA